MAVIDQNKINEIKKKLKDLPRVERVKTYSGPEALEALQKEIRTLSRKGYDSKEIAKILKQEGLSASSAKIRKILVDESGENGSPVDPAPTDPQPVDPEPAEPQLAESDGAQAGTGKQTVRRRSGKPKINGMEVPA